MCRHLGYLGPPETLHALLFEPEHSLLRQATAPRYQIGTHDNPDGFGAGWYVEGSTEPVRYRTAKPMWSDDAFAARAAREHGVLVLGAVRNATPGSALDDLGNAPFVSGRHLFSHNGVIAGYRDGVEDALRARVSLARRSRIEGDTDSEMLFALTLDRLDGGASPAEALTDTVRLVKSLGDGSLNLLLTDGHTIAATAIGNSLFTMTNGPRRVVASEPYDHHSSWSRVDDSSVVTVDAAGIHVSPIT